MVRLQVFLFWDLINSQQLLNRDRQIAHSLAGRVIDGISDCWRNRYRGKFAQALGANWARFPVELTNEDNVKLWNVCRSRHEVAGIVSVKESTQRGVSFGLFKQGLSDTPNDSPDGLAARYLWIDDLAAVVGSDKSPQAHDTEIGIDDYFDEHRRKAKNRLRSFRAWVVVSIGRQRRKVVSRQQLDIADLQILFRKHKAAISDDHLVNIGIAAKRIRPSASQLDCFVTRGLCRQHNGGTGVCHRS